MNAASFTIADTSVGDIPTISVLADPTEVEEGSQLLWNFSLTEAVAPGGLAVELDLVEDTDPLPGDITYFVEESENITDFELVIDEETGLIDKAVVTLAPGATSATLVSDIIADSATEGPESVVFALAEANGYDIDSDVNAASFTIADTSVASDDIINGGGDDDRLNGSQGDDTINGRGGNDRLNGGQGDDALNGGFGNDLLLGRAGNDILIGRPGFDRLLGGSGDDTLEGGIGRDRLNGGSGDDVLSGGASIDRFIFNTNQEFNPEDLGIDEITDFVPGKDLILLDKTTFSALISESGTGFSIDAEFETVTNNQDAATANGFIVYNTETGDLFYNSNGSEAGFGSGGQFAQLTNTASLSEDDFFLRG